MTVTERDSQMSRRGPNPSFAIRGFVYGPDISAIKRGSFRTGLVSLHAHGVRGSERWM